MFCLATQLAFKSAGLAFGPYVQAKCDKSFQKCQFDVVTFWKLDIINCSTNFLAFYRWCSSGKLMDRRWTQRTGIAQRHKMSREPVHLLCRLWATSALQVELRTVLCTKIVFDFYELRQLCKWNWELFFALKLSSISIVCFFTYVAL